MHKKVVLIVALCATTFTVIISQNCSYVFGVIVDGGRNRNMSAVGHQKKEADSIDKFNTNACGLSDPRNAEHEFINMAKEGQFPWIASFQITIPDNATHKEQDKSANQTKEADRETLKNSKLIDLHFCSGSFISDKWILSAAHCFSPDKIKAYLRNDKLKVVAGSSRVSSKYKTNANLAIKRIYYHAGFDPSVPVGFDIALVELHERVEFRDRRIVKGHSKRTDSKGSNADNDANNNDGDDFDDQDDDEQVAPFINAICLPLKDRKYNENDVVRIAGWGLSEPDNESSMPSKLLTTDVLIDNTTSCIDKYVDKLKSDKPRKHVERYDDVICASYKTTRDTCQSDSGGPLMQYADSKAVVIGVVSFGIGCATPGVSGIYTRTSAYTNWIKDIVKNGKKATVSFTSLEAASGQKEKHENKAKPGVPVANSESKTVAATVKSNRTIKTTTIQPTEITTTRAASNQTSAFPEGTLTHKKAVTTTTSTTKLPTIKTTKKSLLPKHKIKFFDD